MPNYRVCYFQDCGYAAIAPIVIIRAESKEDAEQNYPKKIRDLGYACTASGKEDLMRPIIEVDLPLTAHARDLKEAKPGPKGGRQMWERGL